MTRRQTTRSLAAGESPALQEKLMSNQMKLGEVTVTIVETTKRKVLFRHPDGDLFVCDKKHLKPTESENETV